MIVEILISCGPLLKKEGVVKTPASANYLDGDSVTFSCKPKYYIHGDIERTCRNGTWSPGWWAWCRDRNLEYALKWMTALLSIFGFVMMFMIIFCLLWNARRNKQREHNQKMLEKARRYGASGNTRFDSRTSKQRMSQRITEKEPLRQDMLDILDDKPSYMREERRSAPSFYQGTGGTNEIDANVNQGRISQQNFDLAAGSAGLRQGILEEAYDDRPSYMREERRVSPSVFQTREVVQPMATTIVQRQYALPPVEQIQPVRTTVVRRQYELPPVEQMQPVGSNVVQRQPRNFFESSAI
ncbi:unnamed protein product [Heligmosomoides polygyrus]|uniref:Sushi domain-containing protein n=1 Tax=Heligmosomoides polygyrus TaxID=6339 RepID=A0A183GSX5_HELPZ|nr:unnamed protein product [Heligmosomoides polygyrus]